MGGSKTTQEVDVESKDRCKENPYVLISVGVLTLKLEIVNPTPIHHSINK